ADGDDDVRLLRIAFDLRAQTLDVHIHQPGVGGMTVAPDLFEEGLPAEHLPRLASQGHEQIEFARCQRHRRAALGHGVTGHVDDDVADGQQLRGLGLGDPQSGTDTSDELLGLERLRHIVVGSGFEAEDDIDGVGLRREHDDGHRGHLADLPADLETVLARQHEVEENEIRTDLLELLESLIPRGTEKGLEAFAFEHNSNHFGQSRVIINYEDSSVHAPIVPYVRLFCGSRHSYPIGPLAKRAAPGWHGSARAGEAWRDWAMMARSNAWASEVDWHTGRWQMRSGTPRPRGWHPPPPRGLLPKRPLTFVEALDSGFRLLRFIPGLSIGSSLIVFTLWTILLTAIGTLAFVQLLPFLNDLSGNDDAVSGFLVLAQLGSVALSLHSLGLAHLL